MAFLYLFSPYHFVVIIFLVQTRKISLNLGEERLYSFPVVRTPSADHVINTSRANADFLIGFFPKLQILEVRILVALPDRPHPTLRSHRSTSDHICTTTWHWNGPSHIVNMQLESQLLSQFWREGGLTIPWLLEGVNGAQVLFIFIFTERKIGLSWQLSHLIYHFCFSKCLFNSPPPPFCNWYLSFWLFLFLLRRCFFCIGCRTDPQIGAHGGGGSADLWSRWSAERKVCWTDVRAKALFVSVGFSFYFSKSADERWHKRDRHSSRKDATWMSKAKSVNLKGRTETSLHVLLKYHQHFTVWPWHGWTQMLSLLVCLADADKSIRTNLSWNAFRTAATSHISLNTVAHHQLSPSLLPSCCPKLWKEEEKKKTVLLDVKISSLAVHERSGCRRVEEWKWGEQRSAGVCRRTCGARGQPSSGNTLEQ